VRFSPRRRRNRIIADGFRKSRSQRRGDRRPAGGSPFAERLARGAATIVALGRPPRVLFANSAALTLFAAPDLAALEAHLFSPSSPARGA